MAVRRGAITAFLGADEALWVRRGAVVEVTALDVQTVLRSCVRQAPPALDRRASALLRVGDQAADALLRMARPGLDEQDGLAARTELLAGLSTPTPLPHHPTGSGPARVVAHSLLRDPANPTGLNAWAARLHVSTKTLQRDFTREYDTSFSTWRTHIRLRASLAMLTRWNITETAHRVGYASASSYVAAFTREYGEPPGRHHQRTAHRRAR